MKDMETQYEHARGKTLSEVLNHDQGIERWGHGRAFGPFGTVKDPVVIVSALPERVVGCLGDGGEHEHSLMWFLLPTDGPKHMCPQCGQVFKGVSKGPEVPQGPAMEEADRQVAEREKGVLPANPDGTRPAPEQ
jgi:hypothetical protein